MIALAALGTAAGAGFWTLASRGAQWDVIRRSWLAADPGWTAAAIALLACSFLVRSARWHGLLVARLPVSFGTVFWANMAGYAGNALLPLRAGEIVRSYLVGAASGQSKSYCLAAAVVERLLDAMILCVALLGYLTLMPDLGTGLKRGPVFLTLAAGLATAGGVYWWKRTHSRSGHASHSANAWTQRAIDFGAGFLSLVHGRRGPAAILWSLTGWGLECLAGSATASALHIELSPQKMFFFLAVLGLASTIPSAPGYLGTYQLVGITVLVPLGWNRDESLAFATLLQAMVMGCSVLLGLPGLWRFRRLGGNPVAANPLRPGQPAGAD